MSMSWMRWMRLMMSCCTKWKEVLDLMPSFVQQRGEVYTYLCEVLSDMLGIEYKK